jgi:four helix bundle protein
VTVAKYSELLAWQKAMDLVKEVYKITNAFPPDERFGLTNQLRRAPVSISSNIAEGQSRASRAFVRYLSIAQGSLAEVETQMLIAQRLGYVGAPILGKFQTLAAETGRLIHGLSNSIEKHAAAH